MGVFGISSFLLLLSAFWAVQQDFNPEWKGFQQEFMALTLKRAQQQIDRENAKVELQYKKKLDDIDHKIRELTDAGRSVNHQKIIENKRRELAELVQKDYEHGRDVAFAKSELGAARSKYEFMKNDPHVGADEVERLRKVYEEKFNSVQKLQPGADSAYQTLTKAKDELKELEKGPADWVRTKDGILAEQKAWKAEVEKIHPSDMIHYTANAIRDVPLLDFVNPKFNLKQLVLSDLPDLTKSAKVDRCMTCHLGINDVGYNGEDVPMVYRTHPKLDLFVGKDSPHPVEKFGCTICHLGRGYGTTFRLAAHTPNSEDQAKEWGKNYGWSAIHDWDYPMLPERNQEAMCFNCHKTTYELTMARKVFEGRKVYERRGCHGCHNIEGVSDDMKKIGPTLKQVAAKINPDWAPRWIAGPRNFYETARMPHPFGHKMPSEDTFPEMIHHFGKEFDKAHEDMNKEEAVMIDAVAAFLFDKSDKSFESKMEDPPKEPGDPAAGKKLVSLVNCLGCHKVDDLNAPGQGFAPDLSKVGSKTNRKWLYNWLKDPKKYWPEGNMPNPRLSDEEANNVAAYLVTLKDDAYMGKPLPDAPEKLLEEIAVRYKRAKLSEEQAKAEVGKLSAKERKLYVGEETVYRNGCFGCHEIAGFEGRGKIGTELTAEGFKEIERFDFGIHKYVHIPHTRHDWIRQKVKQPYIYSLGKVSNPYEQSFAMPWFGFSDDDADKITTFILGQSGVAMPAKYRYEPRGNKEAIMAGRKIVERRNCIGCHPVGLGWQYVDPATISENKSPIWMTDPVVAQYDPNLPDGRFSKVAQVKDDNVKREKDKADKVLLPKEGFFVGSSQVIFGEQYVALDDIFAKTPVEVEIGGKDQVKVPLEHPAALKAMGVGEGYAARYYPEAALAPPMLRREGAKVNPDWFFKFLKNVTTIRNHIDPLRMPQFDLTDDEANSIVKYFAAAAEEPFPFQTVEVADLNDSHKAASKDLFGLPGTDEYGGSLKCLSCHPTGDLMPTNTKESWGPNLYLAHDRLKFSFVKSWLTNPSAWAPGTRMPNFFYDKDGDKIVTVREKAPQEIAQLAEMLYHLSEIDDVKIAAKKAAELAVKEAAKKKAEPAEVFEEEDAGGKDKKMGKKPEKEEEFVN